MLSYNYNANARFKTTEMENTFYEFKPPDVISEARPRAKRIAELNQSLALLSQKKNHNYRSSIMSAKKFSNVKPASLSQNMSTSKKIVIEKKRMGYDGIRRAIDFSTLQKNRNFINSENCVIRNGTLNSQTTTSTLNNNSTVSTRCSYYPKLEQLNVQRNIHTESLKTTPKSTKKTPIRSASKKCTSSDQNMINPQSSKRVNSIPSPAQPIITKKRTPLKSIDTESNLNISSCSSSSDKENGDEVSNMKNLVSNKTIKLMNSYQRALDDCLQIPDCPMDQNNIQSLIQKNFKIMFQIMKQSNELIKNNMELLNVVSNASLLENKAVLKEKQLSEIVTNGATLEQPDDIIQEHPLDLRRRAFANLSKTKIVNSLQEKSPESKMKRSRIMYDSMKSNMKFLKTPKGQEHDNKFETPNARCRSITSVNVQKQLEKLFDT